jgi:hypothetical protein
MHSRSIDPGAPESMLGKVEEGIDHFAEFIFWLLKTVFFIVTTIQKINFGSHLIEDRAL